MVTPHLLLSIALSVTANFSSSFFVVANLSQAYNTAGNTVELKTDALMFIGRASASTVRLLLKPTNPAVPLSINLPLARLFDSDLLHRYMKCLTSSISASFLPMTTGTPYSFRIHFLFVKFTSNTTSFQRSSSC
uniref:Lectin_legB domain-containing protein n=1 Tax=Ascaris lumbricoides TaxID=6252 RepID=A0A0M3IAL5_ASCLU